MPSGLPDRGITVTEACYILGITAPTFYAWIKKHDDFPTRDEHGKFSELDIIEWASKRAIRTAKIVR